MEKENKRLRFMLRKARAYNKLLILRLRMLGVSDIIELRFDEDEHPRDDDGKFKDKLNACYDHLHQKGEAEVKARSGETIKITRSQFGKKAGEHCKDYGLDASKEEDRKKFFSIVADILENSEDVKSGDWRGQKGPAYFHIKENDVVVTNNNRYVTILKGGINNERVKNARK